jgi:hypothetical protein
MVNSTFLPDIIFLVEQAGLGTYGTSLFKGARSIIPAGDGPFTTITLTGGAGEEGTHNMSRTDVAYERPSGQVTIRATDTVVAEVQAFALYNLLNFFDTFVNGTWWRKCGPKQEPFDLGPDEKNRARFAFNIESVKRVSPATS